MTPEEHTKRHLRAWRIVVAVSGTVMCAASITTVILVAMDVGVKPLGCFVIALVAFWIGGSMLKDATKLTE